MLRKHFLGAWDSSVSKTEEPRSHIAYILTVEIGKKKKNKKNL